MKRYLLAIVLVLLPTIASGQIIRPGFIPGGLKRPTGETSMAGTRPAFPEARGFAAMALSSCTRTNVQVLQVTNTNDSGSGSYRQAIADANSDNRLKVIIFRVAGYINFGSDLTISKPCIYIAGQTAPGGGITMRASGSRRTWVSSGSRDLVVRYLRFAEMTNSFIVRAGPRILVDHISSRWMSNTSFTFTKYDTHGSAYSDATLSHSMLYESGMSGTPLGTIVSGATRWHHNELARVDVHNNLYAHNSHRNPLASIHGDGNGGIKAVNNVGYNWNQNVHMNAQIALWDVINNFAKPGPTTGVVTNMVSPNCFDTPPSDAVLSHTGGAHVSVYAEGNLGMKSTKEGDDNWNGSTREVGCLYGTPNPPGTGGIVLGLVDEFGRPRVIRRTTPQPGPTHAFPITLKSATQTWNYVVVNRNAGANARVTCDGTWVSNIDSVDARIYTETVNGTRSFSGSFPTTPPAGGHPSIAAGTACTYDSTGDGIPTAFKNRYGLSTSTSHASIDTDGDGWTDAEEYVNGTNPLAFTATMR